MIAEKVNSLPSREELEQSVTRRHSRLRHLLTIMLIRSILSLENDMAAIRAEHENQDRVLQAQKAALDIVIRDISQLRLMGKQDVAEDSTPAPETQPGDEDVEMDGSASVRTREESGELKEDAESSRQPSKKPAADGHDSEDDIPLAKAVLNPAARSFVPSSRTDTPLTAALRSTPAQLTPKIPDEDDIEMGEIEDSKDTKKKKAREEELEEGEASDESSELSEPPDD